jgi:hypothetical protein
MNSPILSKIRYGLGSLSLMLLTLAASAQDKIEIDQQEVGNWFQRNWMWVVGGALLLIIIIALSSRGSSTTRRTKTVVRDELGNVRTTTTTETQA